MDVVLIVLLILILLFLTFGYLVHILMTLFQRVSYDWVDFNTFIKTFYDYKENRRCDVSECFGSIHLTKGYYQVVAQLTFNLICFHGGYMIFYPLSYLRYLVWLLKETSPTSNRVKGLWKKEEEKK